MRQVIQRTVIYVRKSTESEERQVLSIDSQIDELVDYAARSGLAIQKLYRESQSANEPGCPIFEMMMADIQRRSFEVVLCWKLDCLARNPVNGRRPIWAMELRQLSEICTQQYSYETTANEEFWMKPELGMARSWKACMQLTVI